MESQQKKVAVLVFNGVELLDMNGPIDTFLRANKYKVYTVAVQAGVPIHSETNIVTITPEFSFTNCPDPDIVVIPGLFLKESGGPGVVGLDELNWIRKMGNNGKVIMSVCIGAFSLAATGLLNGKRATTHYSAIKSNAFHEKYPEVKVIKNVRVEEDGQFVTTGGITSGIDGALYLIEKYDGKDCAQNVADVLVYNKDAPLPPHTIV